MRVGTRLSELEAMGMRSLAVDMIRGWRNIWTTQMGMGHGAIRKDKAKSEDMKTI